MPTSGITYELAKSLKEAGFPLKYISSNPRYNEIAYSPTLSELIEACGELHPDWWFEIVKNGISQKWVARFSKYPSTNNQHAFDYKIYISVGEYLEEAVAALWLELNKK